MATQSYGFILDFRQPVQKDTHSLAGTSIPTKSSLERLKSVHYRIFQFLKEDYPHALLPVNHQSYEELIPVVYIKVVLRRGGLYGLLRGLVCEQRNGNPNITEPPVFNTRVLAALKETRTLEIQNLGDEKRIKDILSLWKRSRPKTDRLIPNLQHLILGERAIENGLIINEEHTLYTANPKKYHKEHPDCFGPPRPYISGVGLDIIRSVIQLSSARTLCISWPTTLIKEPGEEWDDPGNILDWYIPSLLDELEPTSIALDKIVIHLDYDNLGKLIYRLVTQKPNWGNHRPRIILDFIHNYKEKAAQNGISSIFNDVIQSTEEHGREYGDTINLGLFEERAISFQLFDNGNKDAAIEEVSEDVYDDYESLFDTVKDAIRWKAEDNLEDWICPCGNHVPSWERKSRLDNVDEIEEDPTQRKIDQYFKPLAKT